MRKITLITLFLICIDMMIICGFNIYLEKKEYRQGEDLYSLVEEEACSEPEPKRPTDKKNANGPHINFKKLGKKNPDIVAWLYGKKMRINYPVVQGKDNEYYLHHLFDRSKNKAGCIFMDAGNEKDFSSEHTILYGHHMKNGSMFGCLVKYKKESYYKKHKTLLLLTADKNYYIRLFSGYVCSQHGDAWQQVFLDEEDFNDWIRSAKEKSDFNSRIQPKAGDRIITLSTCSYEFKNARYVLHGVLEEEKE